MTTHFITAEVAVQASPEALQQAIETELRRQGEPLRWAVTQVEADQAQVEAVVLLDAEPVGVG
jgi:anti-sigma-K factor RskA